MRGPHARGPEAPEPALSVAQLQQQGSQSNAGPPISVASGLHTQVLSQSSDCTNNSTQQQPYPEPTRGPAARRSPFQQSTQPATAAAIAATAAKSIATPRVLPPPSGPLQQRYPPAHSRLAVGSCSRRISRLQEWRPPVPYLATSPLARTHTSGMAWPYPVVVYPGAFRRWISSVLASGASTACPAPYRTSNKLYRECLTTVSLGRPLRAVRRTLR